MLNTRLVSCSRFEWRARACVSEGWSGGGGGPRDALCSGGRRKIGRTPPEDKCGIKLPVVAPVNALYLREAMRHSSV
jgi:hypothetical protein